MAFKSASKRESKLRLAIAGPPGSGKTYTSLTIATALAPGGRVAVIDTEHGSASKYANLFTFDVEELDSYHPDAYTQAIRAAEAAGYDVLVIDSLSHAWIGEGGVLEEKDRIAQTKHRGNTFNAWADASKLQNGLVNAILASKLHIICTMRTKIEYVIEQTEKGRSQPRKVGMAPVQRDDVQYEFDVYGVLDIENCMVIEKSRCPALSGQVIRKPGAQLADTLRAWLSAGAKPVADTPRAAPDPVAVVAANATAQQAFAQAVREAEEAVAGALQREAELPTGQPQLEVVQPAPAEEPAAKPAPNKADALARLMSAMNDLANLREKAGDDVNTLQLVRMQCIDALGIDGPFSEQTLDTLRSAYRWVMGETKTLQPEAA